MNLPNSEKKLSIYIKYNIIVLSTITFSSTMEKRNAPPTPDLKIIGTLNPISRCNNTITASNDVLTKERLSINEKRESPRNVSNLMYSTNTGDKKINQ